MKTLSLTAIIFSLFLVYSCSKSTGNSFGEEITIKKTSQLKDLVNQIGKTEDEVVIEGKVTEVCQAKGCWLKLSQGNMNIRVTFKNYGFFVPKNISGQTVKLQGKLISRVLPQAEARHYAQDAGKSKAEIEHIVGDKTIYQFIASGVILKDRI